MSESPQHSQPVETVVCLGSSTTASRRTYKWIDELEKRPQNSRFRFVNLGVGGDLSFNTVRRLDRVINERPDRVIVLIGTNDVLASVFPNFRRFARVGKRISDEPSPARFEENLNFVVHKLRRRANTRIGLSSLAPLGEEPDSRDLCRRSSTS
jgi:lysophospholipase L1-like esterase